MSGSKWATNRLNPFKSTTSTANSLASVMFRMFRTRNQNAKRPNTSNSIIFTAKITNQPTTLRRFNTRTVGPTRKNCPMANTYILCNEEININLIRHNDFEVLWSGAIFLYWIHATNSLAIFCSEHLVRSPHLHKHKKRWVGEVYAYLFNIPYHYYFR